jgi:hypothetical protein
MGLRVVCPFLSNVDEVERVLEEHFTVTERDEKGANLGAKEFYYESLHFLVRYPESIVQACGLAPGTLVEVQVPDPSFRMPGRRWSISSSTNPRPRPWMNPCAGGWRP